MIRAIKVESCEQCENLEHHCEYYRRKRGIPDSCPLPPWPSVTKKSIGYWRELIKQFEADGLDSIDVFEDMFKSIGVEVTGGAR